MNYEIKGELIKKFDTETFASGFQKRSAVIRTQDTYPQEVLVEFTKDKIDLLDAHEEGDMVTVGFNLNGRRWESPNGEVKWFNSLIGWKIIAGENPGQPQKEAPKTNPQKTTAHPEQAFGKPTKKEDLFEEEDDGLPF